jgi:hypothetical protein
MTDELKTKLGVPEAHTLVEINHSSEQRHGRDKDEWTYDESDEQGNLVAKCYVTEDMDIHTQKSENSYRRVAIK